LRQAPERHFNADCAEFAPERPRHAWVATNFSRKEQDLRDRHFSALAIVQSRSCRHPLPHPGPGAALTSSADPTRSFDQQCAAQVAPQGDIAMTPLSRCLPDIAILLTAISSPIHVEARQQWPDTAECSQRPRDQLVIKSLNHDFAIVRHDPAPARQIDGAISARAEIKLGTAHKVDRSIFFSQKSRATETNNAHR
jgi:hypothetical protein